MLYAQNSKADSLMQQIEKAKPEEKIQLLHELHVITYSNDYRKSYHIAKKAIELAQKHDMEQKLTRSYQDLGISYIVLGEADSALRAFQKALNLAEKFDDKHGIGACKRNIGTAMWYKNDIRGALPYYKESTKIFKKLGDEQQLATCISNLATAHYALGDYKKSIEYYEEAYQLIDTVSYPGEAASFLNDIGTIYKEWGNNSMALEYFLRAFELNRIANNKRQMATALHNVGGIYFENENYDLALEYYVKGLDMEKELNNTLGIPYSYISLGALYSKKSQYDSAILSLNKAYEGFKKVENKQGIATALAHLGDVYQLIENYKKSRKYYGQAVQYAREIEDNKTRAHALSGTGRANFFLNHQQKALEAILTSITLAKIGNYVHLLEKNYQYLADIYATMGMKNKQIQSLKNYIAIKDTVLTLEKQKQASELLAKYETEKKENRIKLLNKEKEISQSKLTQQRAVLIAAIVVIILVLFAIVLLYRRYRDKKRTNELLNQKNLEISRKQEKISAQNQKLEEQAAKLKELDELKTRFFTNISHEFRTPLTLIIGPLEQIIHQTRNRDTRSSLKLMMRNARRLLELINQLLSISRLEHGEEKLQLQKGDISKHIAFIVEMFTSKALENNTELQIQDDNEACNGYFDKEKLEQILFNLLSNAIKNTKDGEINVSITSQNQEKAVIHIADTGKGIDKNQLPYIFDRFYTSGQSNEAVKASTGIGLSYVYELVKLYNGDIKVESEIGRGTTFTLTLPLELSSFRENTYEIISPTPAKPENEPVAMEPVEQNEVPQDKNENQQISTILVVEDHEELRKFVTQNLSKEYKVTEAANGREGIERAQKEMPDLIITDIMMPEVDGIELTSVLKKDSDTSHIPIIMLTAKASEASRIEALETRADDYLTKPFSIRELILRIGNILRMRNELREHYKNALEVDPAAITTNSVDAKFMQNLLSVVNDNMENPDFSVDMLCEKAGVSRTTLHKKLKSLVNQSATEFINSVRLKRAAKLIRQKTGNISEIAYEVGYNNLSYFSRMFKKQFGKTPKEMMGE